MPNPHRSQDSFRLVGTLTALLLGATASGCQTQEVNGPAAHGQEPCWSCGSAEDGSHLSYTAPEVAAAIEGTWSGEFEGEGEFPAMSITVDIQLGDPVYGALSPPPSDCDVPSGTDERCAGMFFHDAGVLTTSHPEWREQEQQGPQTVEVSGSDLDCATPSFEGCPTVQFEASVDGTGHVMNLVFTSDNKIWVKFAADSETDFVEIGQKD